MARYIINDSDGRISPIALRDALANLTAVGVTMLPTDGGATFTVAPRESHTVALPTSEQIERFARYEHISVARASALLIAVLRQG